MSKVTFSKNTLAILKNFSNLNSNLLVTPGNIIKTITPSKTGMAVATIEETFDVQFGIWDLNKFLGVASLFTNPSFEFDEKFVKIKNGGNSVVKYFYSEPKLLTYPTKDVIMPTVSVSLTLTEKNFSELQKASSVMQLSDLSFKPENEGIVAMVSDLSDPTTNSYKVMVADKYSGPNFLFNFKMENIKILPGDYTLNFGKNVVGEFVNKGIPIKYWFAMEANTSNYGE